MTYALLAATPYLILLGLAILVYNIRTRNP
jgi:hypothetical protein